MMITRILQKLLAEEIAKQKKSIVLLGPRQTGKSTLLRQLKPDLVIELSDEEVYREHLKDPSLLKSQVLSLKKKAVILVDEVQRIPSILNTVQYLIDQKKDFLFLLTGSSARKLKRGDANLLPGRVFWYHLYPFTYHEIKDQWSLEKALTQGTLPEIYLNDYGPELLSNYINTYLREEIQAEALIRNIDSYARFLDLAAESSGKMINYSELSSDSEIPKETLRRFYDLLSDTLIVHRLRGYTDIKGSRKAVQKEMFIFFDMGVRNAVLKQHRNVFTPTQYGELFQQWLIKEMMAIASYKKLDWEFYFYRDDLQQEVDLIIDCGQKIMAIEIKYSKKFKPAFAKHLLAFEKYAKKKVELYLVYCGETAQLRNNIQVIPYQKFLETFI